jgi:hypothetical protein
VHERQGEIEPALHSARVALDLAVRRLGQADTVEKLVAALAPFLAGDAVHRGLQPEMLASGEERIECSFLQGGADHPPHLRSLLDHVVAGDRCSPGGGRQQRGEHVDGGRLARAVRAEESVDLAGPDAQVDAVDCAWSLLELAHESLRDDAVLVGA